jgi:hypothetical protein
MTGRGGPAKPSPATLQPNPGSGCLHCYTSHCEMPGAPRIKFTCSDSYSRGLGGDEPRTNHVSHVSQVRLVTLVAQCRLLILISGLVIPAR